MLEIIETTRSVADVEKSFPEAAKRRQFGVLGVHNLRQKMKEKGVSFEKECLVFEVCNPQQAKKVLDGNMGISTVLPCRVSVYEENGKTKIATIKPTALITMFQEPGLKAVAEEVEKTLLDIMTEAAGKN